MKVKLPTSLLCFLMMLLFTFGIFAQSSYKINCKTEAIILSSGVGLMLASEISWHSVHAITEEEINRLSKYDINPFDRCAVKFYSANKSRASDVLLGACALAPLTLFLNERIRSDYGVAGLMYGETFFITYFLTDLIKSNGRIRPFLYNPKVPLHKKLKWGKDAKASFPSGHTSMAFASAVLLSTLFCDYFPESKYKPLVWTGSLLLATTVGYLRFVSGVHFPTDILGGAVFGSAVGFLVPQLHQNSNSSEESNNLSYRIFPFQIMLLYNF